MILSCPACQTTFTVADAIFGTRPRRVRCGKCKHEWQATPPVIPEVPADLAPPPTYTKPIPKGSALPAPKEEPSLWDKHGRMLSIAGGVLLAALLLLNAMSNAGVSLWPFGATADVTEHLVLEDIKTRYETQGAKENGEPIFVLVVEGLVRNTDTKPVHVPPIIIETKNKNGTVLASQTASLQTQTLPPGQTGSFLQTFESPADDLADITVAFSEENTSPETSEKQKDAEPNEH